VNKIEPSAGSTFASSSPSWLPRITRPHGSITDGVAKPDTRKRRPAVWAMSITASRRSHRPSHGSTAPSSGTSREVGSQPVTSR